ncbi:hypothetical protein CYMTET_19691 [Cymbomonas tetramitiformis]|uniref:Uncharacterized protein n=1 Tax=Cymbomonas tetramitiformis TaxID=36881 RepID=A0AAE0G6T8_9CHLO|nr:hypothetical protein CYMTET_19691 [Cymbomonas tetramitiformis]
MGASLQVIAVACSPANPTDFATGGCDDTAFLYKMGVGGAEPTKLPLRGHTDTVAALAFSSDGSHLATGGLDGRVLVWDAASILCAHLRVDIVLIEPGKPNQNDDQLISSVQLATKCSRLPRAKQGRSLTAGGGLDPWIDVVLPITGSAVTELPLADPGSQVGAANAGFLGVHLGRFG